MVFALISSSLHIREATVKQLCDARMATVRGWIKASRSFTNNAASLTRRRMLPNAVT